MNLIKPFRINSLKTMIPFLQKRYTPLASQLTVPTAVPMSPLTVPMAIPMAIPMVSPLTGYLWANEGFSQYDPCCFTCKHFIKKNDTIYPGKCKLYYYIDDDKQIKYKYAIDENYEMRCKGYLWEMR